MGYRTAPEVVEGMRDYLRDLEAGRACAWETTRGTAERVAYRIREALYVARLWPERFPALAEAADQFRIAVVSPSRVEAQPRSGSPEALIVAQQASAPVTTMMPSPHGRPVVAVSPVLAQQVIDAWLAKQPSNDPLHFAQAALPYEEMVKLHRWARSRPVRLMLLAAGGSLTLAVEDEDVVAHSWKPQEARTNDT